MYQRKITKWAGEPEHQHHSYVRHGDIGIMAHYDALPLHKERCNEKDIENLLVDEFGEGGTEVGWVCPTFLHQGVPQNLSSNFSYSYLEIEIDIEVSVGQGIVWVGG